MYSKKLEFEKFFGVRVPFELNEKYANVEIEAALEQKDIIKIIDFFPPFLRTDKLIIFGKDIVGSRSIGIGKVKKDDMEGHYNNTVYLAFAGRLMPSTTSIHLAYFFPNSAPQAIEGQSIRVEKNIYNNGLIIPSNEGSDFFVESIVLKKKLNLIYVETHIFFGNARFGLIEGLKFFLADKKSIYSAVTIPDVT